MSLPVLWVVSTDIPRQPSLTEFMCRVKGPSIVAAGVLSRVADEAWQFHALAFCRTAAITQVRKFRRSEGLSSGRVQDCTGYRRPSDASPHFHFAG